MDTDEEAEPRQILRKQARKVNYSEEGISEKEFEALLREENQSRAKRRRVEEELEHQADRFAGQLEHETAWAVDFNALALGEEEEELLPADADEAHYVQMRNYVLTKWRSNVSRYLSEEAALSGLPWFHRGYARVAWKFLDTAGYINFGVSPDLLKRSAPPTEPRASIIVIGAGLAGLAAAQTLQKQGFKVVVLEGHSRPGGRVYSRRLESRGIEAIADMGGSILTGIDGNPLAVLAKQLRIPMHDIEQEQVPIYLNDGSLPPKALDEKVEEEYNLLLDRCSDFRDNLGEVADNIALGTSMEAFWEERCASHNTTSGREPDPEEEDLKQRLFNWHTANLEFANAASYKELSVRSWDQDDPHELPGAHVFLPGGNIRLVAALTTGLSVLYNSKVERIAYSAEGVAVQTVTHVIRGDAVLVTVPLGVLKRGGIQFQPPLPARKLEAIKRIGFGLLNKIVLLFPYAFWGKRDMFGRLAELTEERGEFYLFYSYAGLSGGAVLAGLVSGDAAKAFEETSCEHSTKKVMDILRGIFEPKGVWVPPPLQVCCTRWGKDEMAFGSYSSMAVGALGGEDYDVLAENVGGRLFFAGEATTKKYPATMHGAFTSGLREAANISATFSKRRAEDELVASKVSKNLPLSGPGQFSDVAIEQAMLTSFYAMQISKIFSDPRSPPDIEFGCFSAVKAPAGSQWEHRALLQVDIGAARGRGSAKVVFLFVVILTRDLYRMQDMSGGDDNRFGYLASIPDLKLVGRQGMSPDVVGLVRAVLEQRGLSSQPAATKMPLPTVNTLAQMDQQQALSFTWNRPKFGVPMAAPSVREY